VVVSAAQERNVKFIAYRNLPSSVAGVVCIEGVETELDDEVARDLVERGLGEAKAAAPKKRTRKATEPVQQELPTETQEASNDG
jgi:hypothetical protein